MYHWGSDHLCCCYISEVRKGPIDFDGNILGTQSESRSMESGSDVWLGRRLCQFLKVVQACAHSNHVQTPQQDPKRSIANSCPQVLMHRLELWNRIGRVVLPWAYLAAVIWARGLLDQNLNGMIFRNLFSQDVCKQSRHSI